MRKLFIVLAVCLLISFVAVNVFADRFDREAGKPGYVNSYAQHYDAVVTDKPCYVYALSVYAAASNSYVYLYDSDDSTVLATTEAASDKVKAEAGEATQYETTRYVYDPPIKFENGVYADVTSGAYIVEYR